MDGQTPGEAQALTEQNNAETNLKQYSDPNLVGQTNQKVQDAWSPLLKNSVQASQDMMSKFLPTFNNIGNIGLSGGTDENSLTPQMKMQQMSQGLGDLAGRLNSATSLSDYLGGKASDMAQKAQDALKFGYQTASDAYSRAAQRYQQAFQAAEAQRQRAAAAHQLDLLNQQKALTAAQQGRANTMGTIQQMGGLGNIVSGFKGTPSISGTGNGTIDSIVNGGRGYVSSMNPTSSNPIFQKLYNTASQGQDGFMGNILKNVGAGMNFINGGHAYNSW